MQMITSYSVDCNRQKHSLQLSLHDDFKPQLMMISAVAFQTHTHACCRSLLDRSVGFVDKEKSISSPDLPFLSSNHLHYLPAIINISVQCLISVHHYSDPSKLQSLLITLREINEAFKCDDLFSVTCMDFILMGPFRTYQITKICHLNSGE